MWKKLVVVVASSLIALPAFAAKPDSWITTKAKLALWTTADVHSTSVNVDTINGAVTIFGTVDDAAERARAERVVRKIDGVKAVRDLLQIVPPNVRETVRVNDEQLKAEVEKALKSNEAVAASTIGVQSVNNSVVLLTGTTPSLAVELEAVRAARSIDGVKHVATAITEGANAAQVEERGSNDQGGHHASDGWLTTEVKMKLLADSDVPALDVNVDTHGGTVSLFGVVPDETARQAAQQDAQQVNGVLKIEDHLQIVAKTNQKSVQRKDEIIAHDLKRSLTEDRDLANVGVDVHGGVVRLTGTVPTRGEKLEAAIVSRSTRGVRSVANELRVKDKND